MDTEELKKYYRNKQVEYQAYLDKQLSQFKDSNKQYLSAVVANYCNQAEALLNKSNETAFSRFYGTMIDLEQRAKSNCPSFLLERMAESAKRTLESSLKFNQDIFDQTVAYNKSLLKK